MTNRASTDKNARMREEIHQNESASQKHQGLSQLIDAITTHHALSHTIFEIAALAKTCHKNNQPNFAYSQYENTVRYS